MFTNAAYTKLKTNQQCKKTLEGIVHKPESCVLNYFNQITREFKLNDQIVFTSQAESFILKFSKSYGVFVVLIDAVGKFTAYGLNNGQNINSSLDSLYYVVQNYLNVPVFAKYNALYYYNFNIFSKIGEYFNVFIISAHQYIC